MSLRRRGEGAGSGRRRGGGEIEHKETAMEGCGVQEPSRRERGSDGNEGGATRGERRQGRRGDEKGAAARKAGRREGSGGKKGGAMRRALGSGFGDDLEDAVHCKRVRLVARQPMRLAALQRDLRGG